MHIAVTDLLTCPGCGPMAGLVLLADEISDRRVATGTLGCPSCRAQYAIRNGIARLDESAAARDADAASAPAVGAGSGRPAARDAAASDALRWAALLGITEGPGHALLVGPVASIAGDIASIVPDVEFIAASRYGGERPAPRVSVIRIGASLPLCGGRIRGVALSGPDADPLLDQAARTVMVGGRLVARPAPLDVAERLAEAGMQVLARQDDTVVAQRG